MQVSSSKTAQPLSRSSNPSKGHSDRLSTQEVWCVKSAGKTENLLIDLGVPKETYDVVKQWHKCVMDNTIYKDFIIRINKLKHRKEHMNMIKQQLLMFYNINSIYVKSLLDKIEGYLKQTPKYIF